MNHKQDRATLLEEVGLRLPGNSRGREKGSVHEGDYLAVPPPFNLEAHPVGDCLIWLWTLNDGGYGTYSFPGTEQLAHRQTYYQSREKHAKLKVLHLCHRPYCIQPSHLYEGTPQDNSDDRRLRTGPNLNIGLAVKKLFITQQVAKYRWESPVPQMKPMLYPVEAGAHECRYIIPAGDRKICPICRNPEDPHMRMSFQEEEPEFQPLQEDQNIHQTARHRRTFKDLGEGLTLRFDGTIVIETPTNRAEQRRREREARKNRADEPVLLGQRTGVVDPRNPAPMSFSIPPDKRISGPGVILVETRAVRRPTPEEGRKQGVTQRILQELRKTPSR